MRDKKRRKGTKMGSNASEDPLNFRGWVGSRRGPASDQGGSYKVPPFQNPQFRKSRGGGGPGPVPPSGSAHEMFFSYAQWPIRINPR